MCEQFQKKLTEILNQKQEYLDQIEDLENKLKATKEKVQELNQQNDKYHGEHSNKVMMKDSQIEKLNEELRSLRSTVKS